MKTKHRLLSLLMLGAIIALLAYSAGARHNQLSSQQMSFSSLSSNQNQNQLKAHMRDALISKLNTRASNHELRIATYAQSSSHPQLSSQQLSFNSYLSTNNNNMLTAHMRDNLTTQFGNTISNHEMRIRCIEDGSCLNTSHCPTTPSNPSPEEWHCVERETKCIHKPEYSNRNSSQRFRPMPGCYCKGNPVAFEECSKIDKDPSCQYGFIQSGATNNPQYNCQQIPSVTPKCLWVCNNSLNNCDKRYCEQLAFPTFEECANYTTQSACSQDAGCSRVKK